MRQLGKKLVELLLAIGEFSAPAVIDAETSHDAVDDEQTVLVGREVCRKSIEKLKLMLGG